MSTTRYIVDNQSEQTINNEPILRPYKVYTALLTQSDGDSILEITTGDLTIGVTYEIYEAAGGAEGFDFTNVGAPNNNLGTFFVATGTTPNSWGNNNIGLRYNEGAPVVTVLENTIGNIWFTYDDIGRYIANSNSLFINSKTCTFFGLPYTNENIESTITQDYTTSTSSIISFWTFHDGVPTNYYLLNTPIEIRLYNTPELPS